MASTILQSLNRWRDGLLLLESFESTNFMLDQAWTLLNGTPTTSTDVAIDGLRSFKLDLTYPWIEKDFTPAATEFKFSAVYFFDDSGVVTGGYKPMVHWISDNGQTWGIGVDLSVSTTKYTIVQNGVPSASSVTRTDGFHRFDLYVEEAGLQLAMHIDNVSVASIFFPTADHFRRIRIGASVASGTIAFGYFDLVQCCVTATMIFYGLDPGQNVSIYDEDGTLIVASTSLGYSNHSMKITLTTQDSPFNGYIAITRTDGVRPYFRSAPFSLSLGDRQQLSVYDFGRKPSGLSLADAADRNDYKAVGGPKQSVFFSDSDRFSMMFMDLTEDQKNRLDRWWAAAKRGNNFSLAIDGDATFIAKVTAENTDPSTPTLTVDTIAGAGKGSRLVLRTNDGRKKQVVVVASQTGSTITLTEAPSEPVAVDMQVRSLYYWPFMTTMDKSLPWELSNLKQKRWSISLNLEEAIL